MRTARTRLGATVAVSVLCVAEVLAGNPQYDALVLADNPLFFWSFDEADGNAVNLAEPIPENELMPQGNATRELHSEIGSGLLLGRAASFDGEDGIRFLWKRWRFRSCGPTGYRDRRRVLY